MTLILHRASWLGGGASGAAKSPHEQKMASILSTWRGFFSPLLYVLLSLSVLVVLNHEKYSSQAKDIRTELSHRVVRDIIQDKTTQEKVLANFRVIPEQKHRFGVDAPLRVFRMPLIDTTVPNSVSTDYDVNYHASCVWNRTNGPVLSAGNSCHGIDGRLFYFQFDADNRTGYDSPVFQEPSVFPLAHTIDPSGYDRNRHTLFILFVLSGADRLYRIIHHNHSFRISRRLRTNDDLRLVQSFRHESRCLEFSAERDAVVADRPVPATELERCHIPVSGEDEMDRYCWKFS